MPRPDALASAACAAFAVMATMLTPARALPPPPAPPAAATASPSPSPSAGAFLPVGTPIDFVLDDSVSSKKTQPGTTERIHLAKALVVGGVELAPAGTTGTLRVVSTRPALAPDTDGAVQIDLEPLQLPGRGTLPVSVTKAYITIDQTAGQQSTRGLMDTVEDILLPVAALAQAFRKGRELVLPPGTVIRARTAASIDATHPSAVVIATPAPFKLNTDTPHSGFTPIPLYTVPTPQPRAPASPSAVPAATPPPSTAPSATPPPAPTAAGTATPSR